MARRRIVEEHQNHERWLVSYADFITLLFAFFVVMYSVSSVNEGKFRVLADSLVASFPDRMKSLDPIQVGELVRSPYEQPVSAMSKPAIPQPLGLDGQPEETGNADVSGPGGAAVEPPAEDVAALAQGASEQPGEGQSEAGAVADGGPGNGQDGNTMANIDTVAENVKRSMAPLVDDDLVEVRRGESWLEIEFKTSILFTSGSAHLERRAEPVLQELADILKTFPNPVQVEGFTDNVPIKTNVYPSNWELSAARAASVVHLFMTSGVNPQRMVAIGYGQYRPITENETLEGRNRNRRVVVVIPADADTRRILDLQRLSTGQSAASAG